MDLSARPIEAADLDTCAAMLCGRLAYPESLAERLPGVWRRLMRADALLGACIEGRHVATAPASLAFGMSVFVTDAWMNEARNGQEPYLTARTIRRELGGDSPILRLPAIARRNRAGGLNILNLHYGEARNLPADLGHAVRLRMLASFIETHRGYRIKGIIQEIWDEIGPTYVLEGWGQVVTNYAAWFEERGEPLPPLGQRPHLIAVTREDALARPGDPAAPVFVFTPPRCFFSRAEQNMLCQALTGHTDAELARDLGLAMPTIKSRWRAIYHRVARTIPNVLPAPTSAGDRDRRGQEKRRRLLEYLRSHPEELRPVARRRTPGR